MIAIALVPWNLRLIMKLFFVLTYINWIDNSIQKGSWDPWVIRRILYTRVKFFKLLFMGIGKIIEYAKIFLATIFLKEIVFCWYYSWANSKKKFSECNLIFPKLPKLKKRPARKRFLKPRQRRGFGMFTRWPFFQLR